METQKAKQTLTRKERLRGKRNLDALFADGRSGFAHPFRYVWIEAQQPEGQTLAEASVLFSVPKKNHKRANARNTLKRRSREAYRLNKQPLLDALTEKGKKINLALIYSSKEKEEYKTIENAIQKIIARVRAEL